MELKKIISTILFVLFALVGHTQTTIEKLLFDNTTHLFKPNAYLVTSASQRTSLEAYASPLPAGLTFIFKYSGVNMIKITDGASLLANVSDLVGASSSGLVDLSTNQTISGVKTFASQAVFSSGLVSNTNILTNADNTGSIGATSSKWNSIFGNNFLGGTAAFGSTGSEFDIKFRQGTSSQYVGGFFATTGNFVIRSAGSSLGSDSGHKLQVVGSGKFTGNVEFTTAGTGPIIHSTPSNIAYKIVVSDAGVLSATSP